MIEQPSHSPIKEDMSLQVRTWVAERIGWMVLALFVLAGLAGAFSHGVLSSTVVRSADGVLTIDYERFARHTARTRFTIRIADAANEAPRLRLSPAMTEFYDMETIYPQPLRSTASEAGIEFTFARPPDGDLVVRLAARAARFGYARLVVSLDERSRVELVQVIYP